MALSFLDRSHTVAKPGYSRWMVPPAALCVHLCIGQAYALSVFNLPMTRLLGISQSAPGDWKLTEDGSGRVLSRFPSKTEALGGRLSDFAEGDSGISVKIQLENGTLEEERTYPRSLDPRKSEG